MSIGVIQSGAQEDHAAGDLRFAQVVRDRLKVFVIM
jgi:hypothetical protein